jgi:hypothetical protein
VDIDIMVHTSKDLDRDITQVNSHFLYQLLPFIHVNSFLALSLTHTSLT